MSKPERGSIFVFISNILLAIFVWPSAQLVRWANAKGHRPLIWKLIAAAWFLAVTMSFIPPAIDEWAVAPHDSELVANFSKKMASHVGHDALFSRSVATPTKRIAAQNSHSPTDKPESSSWIYLLVRLVLLDLQLVVPFLMFTSIPSPLLDAIRRTFSRLRIVKPPLKHQPGFVSLGVTVGHGSKTIISASERTMHTQIVGATGTGKTETIKRIIEADIASGYGVLWLDGKGDRENAGWFAATAAAYGRQDAVRMMLPTENVGSYNPLLYGNATQLKDLLIGSFNWTEEYYKKRSEEILQAVFTALRSIKNASFTIDDVAKVLDPKDPTFARLMAMSTDQRAKQQLARYARDQDWQEAVGGLRADLNQFALSSFGNMLSQNIGSIDFSEAYGRRQLVYVSLPLLSSPQFVSRLGKLMIGDISALNSAAATGECAKSKFLFSVVVDEFANFVNEPFLAFLREARSQNFAISIAHQSLGDLEALDVAVRKQIQGNTNIKIIFRQDAPEDAETWARLIGTQKSLEKTVQTGRFLLIFDEVPTGQGSLKEVEEFVVHPNVIKRLGTGHAVFVRKQPWGLGVVEMARATQFDEPARTGALEYIFKHQKRLLAERVSTPMELPAPPILSTEAPVHSEQTSGVDQPESAVGAVEIPATTGATPTLNHGSEW